MVVSVDLSYMILIIVAIASPEALLIFVHLVVLLTSYTIQVRISGLGSVHDSMVLMMHSVVLMKLDVVIV